MTNVLPNNQFYPYSLVARFFSSLMEDKRVVLEEMDPHSLFPLLFFLPPTPLINLLTGKASWHVFRHTVILSG